MQTRQHLLKVAALVEHFNSELQVLNTSVHHGRSALLGWRPPAAGIGA
jgi:hypothetical protein